MLTAENHSRISRIQGSTWTDGKLALFTSSAASHMSVHRPTVGRCWWYPSRGETNIWPTLAHLSPIVVAFSAVSTHTHSRTPTQDGREWFYRVVGGGWYDAGTWKSLNWWRSRHHNMTEFHWLPPEFLSLSILEKKRQSRKNGKMRSIKFAWVLFWCNS